MRESASLDDLAENKLSSVCILRAGIYFTVFSGPAARRGCSRFTFASGTRVLRTLCIAMYRKYASKYYCSVWVERSFLKTIKRVDLRKSSERIIPVTKRHRNRIARARATNFFILHFYII